MPGPLMASWRMTVWTPPRSPETITYLFHLRLHVNTINHSGGPGFPSGAATKTTQKSGSFLLFLESLEKLGHPYVGGRCRGGGKDKPVSF